MNFVLTMIICSATTGTCLPPFRLDNFYKDGYDCMVSGYTKSHDKIVELGSDDVNKYKIYIKFGCNEDNSNKTTTSHIIIK